MRGLPGPPGKSSPERRDHVGRSQLGKGFTNSLCESCCSALSIANPSAGVPTIFVAISILWNLSTAGGRGRLQGKHWFSHHCQCDVTQTLRYFQYGGQICYSLRSAKFGIFNDLDGLNTFIWRYLGFRQFLRVVLVVIVRIRFPRASYFEWKHTTK